MVERTREAMDTFLLLLGQGMMDSREIVSMAGKDRDRNHEPSRKVMRDE